MILGKQMPNINFISVEKIETVGKLKETILSFMSSQNAAVMTALADQKVVMSKLVQKEAVACSVKSCFPLSCAEDLFKIDEKVVPENRSLFISTLRNLLQNSVKKNLEKVLSSAVIMDHNVDGTHGKKGLKDHSKFYSVFLESIISLTSNDEPEEQLKKAMQLHKKRVFQKKGGMAKAVKTLPESLE
ncbi:uncharacterized protein [Eurosta solidaginis]|uniref:uncharacterized protein isoform X2 n=1 Tax=Eurosta solidaginis TaxID=178769 RepID=UPI003530DC63